MIRNNLIILFRNSFRKPLSTIINILGLAIGIACFVLTIVYVDYNLNYDKTHKNKDRIHLVTLTLNFTNYFIENQTTTTAQLAEELRTNFPEVSSSTRLSGMLTSVVQNAKTLINEDNIFGVDSTFFDVFTCEFIEGSPEKALTEPNCIVITESIAEKFFENEKAYGRILKLLDKNLKITGVVKDSPKNSVIHFNILASMSTLSARSVNNANWMTNEFTTYIVLKEGIDPMQLENKLPALIKSKLYPDSNGDEFEAWLAKGNRYEYHLFSMQDVHLVLHGNGIYLIGFGIVAIFLLIIACINYMNLSSAKASQRAKEVGVRKTFGANYFNLIWQFISESLFLSFLSLIIAMGIVELVLPFLSDFINVDLSIRYFDNYIVLPVLMGLGLFIGVFSGLYPALILSSYIPIKVLKGDVNRKEKGFNLRNILVFIQFVVSISLIISLVVVVKQTDLLSSKDLGYNKENLMVIKNAEDVQSQKDLFKAELSKIPEIEFSTFTSRIPSRDAGLSIQWTPEGKEKTLFSIHMCDEDFLKTMKIELQAGRFFSKEFSTDSSSVLINQAAARLLDWGDTLHRIVKNGRLRFPVIGVVKDYHFQTLHNEIQPMMLLLQGGKFRIGAKYITIRLKPNSELPINKIEEVWRKFEDETPFEYFIFDEYYKTLYDQERQTRQLMLILTVLILFVTALGLFGLATYATQERMKEIAIRKAIGASAMRIIFKLSWSFTKLVLFANIIAWPLAWYFMNDWLNNFASRINMSWWIFVLAGLLTYLLAILTIIFQAYGAAKKNPVDVLRYE